MTATDPTTRAMPHWVYRIYDAEGVPLYVGCTLDPIRRTRENRYNHWWDQAARIEWDSYADYDEGRAAERLTILRLDPRFNRQRGGRMARRSARAATSVLHSVFESIEQAS